MRKFFSLAAGILVLLLTVWLAAISVWWFIIGLLAGYSIMKDEYETYTMRSDNLREKCRGQDMPFDPVASLGKRGEFFIGIWINGTVVGLILCFLNGIINLLFLT